MSWRPLRHDWPLFSLCLCAFGLYALVHTEARFVGAYVTIFWMAVLSSIRLPDRFPFQRVGAVLCFAGALTLLVSVGVATVRAYRDGGPYSAIGDVHVADRLQAMGLRNGDRVATIGDASYWAHLDRLRIVAEVMGTETAEFWNAEPSHQEELIRAFAATGARAVLVTRVPPGNKLGSEWQVVGAGGYYLRWLRDPPGVS